MLISLADKGRSYLEKIKTEMQQLTKFQLLVYHRMLYDCSYESMTSLKLLLVCIKTKFQHTPSINRSAHFLAISFYDLVNGALIAFWNAQKQLKNDACRIFSVF